MSLRISSAFAWILCIRHFIFLLLNVWIYFSIVQIYKKVLHIRYYIRYAELKVVRAYIEILRWHVRVTKEGGSEMQREKRDRWASLTTLSYSSQLLSRTILPIKLSSWIFYKSIQVIQPSANDASSRTLFHGFSWSRTVRSLPWSPHHGRTKIRTQTWTCTTLHVSLRVILSCID